MIRTALVTLVTLTWLPRASLPAQETRGTRPAPHGPFEVDLARVTWTNFSPRDTTVRYAILYVDPHSGATRMLFRLPPNATSPCHWHTAGESNMVVQGSIAMRHAGAADSVRLGVGGFSHVPKGMPHQLRTGPAVTIVFSALDGRFDFHPVDDSRCGADRH